jgi:hypothetical protein
MTQIENSGFFENKTMKGTILGLLKNFKLAGGHF